MSPEQPILAQYLNRPFGVLRLNIERSIRDPESMIYQDFYVGDTETQVLMLPTEEARRLLGYKSYSQEIDNALEAGSITAESESDVLIIDYRDNNNYQSRVYVPIYANTQLDQISESDLVRGMLSVDGYRIPEEPQGSQDSEELQTYEQGHQHIMELYDGLLSRIADIAYDSLNVIKNDTLGQGNETIFFPIFSDAGSVDPLAKSKDGKSKRGVDFPAVSNTLLNAYKALNDRVFENSTITSGCIDNVCITVLPAEIKTKLVESLGLVSLPISNKNSCLGYFRTEQNDTGEAAELMIEINEFQAEVLAAFARLGVRELTTTAIRSLLNDSVYELNRTIKGKKKRIIATRDITDALTITAEQIERYHGIPADRQDMIQINDTDGKIYKLKLPLPAFQDYQDTEIVA
jgi:hypothetical protein